jgi:predicted extracellular nuclease
MKTGVEVRSSYFSLFLIFLVFIFSCNKRINSPDDLEIPDSLRIDLPRFGSDISFEVMSWNIENFPKLGEQTIQDVAEIVYDLEADLFGLVEIADTSSFRRLLSFLPAYDGIYSDDQYSPGEYQKTAIIFKKEMITISGKKMLFSDDSYSFPRPPLQVYVQAFHNQKWFDFTLIVLHLKAYGGEENEARRRSACVKLKNYLDLEITNSADQDYMVVGDWNDELSDPPAENVFQVFLNDPLNYSFLTQILLNDPVVNATYIGSFNSIIDHILISKDLESEYTNGYLQLIKADQFFSAYTYEVSDHRLVGVKFFVF